MLKIKKYPNLKILTGIVIKLGVVGKYVGFCSLRLLLLCFWLSVVQLLGSVQFLYRFIQSNC
jgi:hypothetical protein